MRNLFKSIFGKSDNKSGRSAEKAQAAGDRKKAASGKNGAAKNSDGSGKSDKAGAKNSRKKKKDWPQIIADKNGWTRDRAEEYLSRMKAEYGFAPGELQKKDLNEMSETSVIVSVLLDRRKKQRKDNFYSLMEEASGKDRKTLQDGLKTARSIDDDKPVTFQQFFRYGGYAVDASDEQAVREWVSCVRKQTELKEAVTEEIEQNGFTDKAYEELENFRQSLGRTLSDARKKYIFSMICKVRADVQEGSAEYDELTADMELTDCVLGFRPDEYAVHHFWNRALPERAEFVSDRFRSKLFKQLNDTEGRDILNSKYDAYLRLKDLYGREIVCLGSENGAEIFSDFCSRHEVFVKKSNYDSLGRGIEKVYTGSGTDHKEIYESLTSEGKSIILEELITPHEMINRLNPSSVNTLRITTLLKDGKASVQDVFLKIGRDGSFVDNGGAGGIFVHVDPMTGITDSDGIIETGERFERHPDHGYELKGIQFPEWEKAREAAVKAAERVPEISYAGWDVTLTEDGRWIIVEGNANTQFIGQQATIGRGVLKELKEAVGYTGPVLTI